MHARTHAAVACYAGYQLFPRCPEALTREQFIEAVHFVGKEGIVQGFFKAVRSTASDIAADRSAAILKKYIEMGKMTDVEPSKNPEIRKLFGLSGGAAGEDKELKKVANSDPALEAAGSTNGPASTQAAPPPVQSNSAPQEQACTQERAGA